MKTLVHMCEKSETQTMPIRLFFGELICFNALFWIAESSPDIWNLTSRVKLKCSLYFTARYINFGSSSGLEDANDHHDWRSPKYIFWAHKFPNHSFFFFYIYKNVFFAYFHVLKMMSLDILNTDVTAAVAFLINGSIS